MTHPLLTVVLLADSTEDSHFLRVKKELEENRVVLQINPPKIHRELYEPKIYVSIGTSCFDFPTLVAMSPKEKERWLHFTSFEDIRVKGLFNCWLSATDPLPINHSLRTEWTLSKWPIVSFFTTTYKSGQKIFRPYLTLLKQHYPHWEWIIVDDSDDDGKTYSEITANIIDPRIKKYRQEKHSGYIGLVKRCAARLCTGEILVELDHDDELTPDTCDRLISAFRENPTCGFAYAETSMVYEGTLKGEWYGWDFAYGYGVAWKQWISQLGKTSLVTGTAELTWKTVRHLIGLPNHPRAWLRECYDYVGAHRQELSVADDFDMIIRTILCTDIIKIPHVTYIQYINSGRNNFTAIRNTEIQILCKQIEFYYNEKINDRLRPLVPEIPLNRYARIWTLPEYKFANKINYTKGESHIFVDPSPDQVEEIQELVQSNEVIVVGPIIPPQIPELSKTVPDGRLRWWRMEIGTYEERVRYAALLTSTDPVNHVVHEPDRESYPIKFIDLFQFVSELVRGNQAGYGKLLIEMDLPILDLEKTQESLRKLSGYETITLEEAKGLTTFPGPTDHEEIEEVLDALVFSQELEEKDDLSKFAVLAWDPVEQPDICQEYVDLAIERKFVRALTEYLPENPAFLLVGRETLPPINKNCELLTLKDKGPFPIKLMNYLRVRKTKGPLIALDTEENRHLKGDRELCVWIDPDRLHLPLRVESSR